VRDKQLVVEKVPALTNPADLMTKHMARRRHQALMDLMGMVDDSMGNECEAA